MPDENDLPPQTELGLDTREAVNTDLLFRFLIVLKYTAGSRTEPLW